MPNEYNGEGNEITRGGEPGNPPGGGPTVRSDENRGMNPGGDPAAQSGLRGENIGDEFTGRGGGPTRGISGMEASQPRAKQRRGFAAMDPAKQREIASKGGKASHEQGTGHEWDSEAAREAGRKGGQASRGGRGKVRASITEGGGVIGTPEPEGGDRGSEPGEVF